jgi:hypothetical protein
MVGRLLFAAFLREARERSTSSLMPAGPAAFTRSL